MIRRDRNHPSVIMWSIGNEIPEQQDRENGAALFAPNSPENVAQATMFDDED